MANFNVRVFGYRGMVQMPANALTQMNTDSVFVLDEPYLWSQVIAVSPAAAETVVVANDLANIIRIEVPDDQSIRFEINPHGPGASDHRVAGNGSPRFTGADQFAWFRGGTVSLIDATALA